MKFDVRYYLVAILFIIFDLEIAFLFPVGSGARPDRHGRLLGDDDLPGHSGGRLHLRVEERGAGMGVAGFMLIEGICHGH